MNPIRAFATLTALLTAGLLSASPATAHGAEISAENIRTFTAIPGAPNTGMFMVLKNASKREVKLLGGESTWSAVLELHDMKMENNMMKMFPVPEIVLPSGGQVELKPGSLHVMLINLKKPPKVGDTVEAVLRFSNGETLRVSGPTIERPVPGQSGSR